MSHKENLMRAARECLLRTGYARTTVRDLVASSGANQASINYHYGSKEALLTRALNELNTEWGDLLFRALVSPDGDTGEDAELARWERIIDSIQAQRDLWFVNFESVSYLKHDAEIRAMNAEGQRRSRIALAAAFAGLGEDADPARVHAVGSHYYSLLVGVALQWLTDPEAAPTAAEIVAADTGR
ncbi:TetR family transcriptional regulator [Actinorhabdospora filicis]|uniref:TetR family transcriptional regulator n=1 Tax=Actinorhabdospora filicis TaxID=1785913 RepID=A0A9W6SP56_9ACTN|nr:TetR/AcrR family transcriptional regulator [Actinorhabdospora filicis]GLZ79576.1 TetR family transcriptional regulator [Actinorhabdospora filicis]